MLFLSWMTENNWRQLGTAILDSWIFPRLQESAKTGRKVIKTSKGTLKIKSDFSSYFR